MKKHFVITSLPVRLPVQSTVLYSFLLHYFNASGILWGIFITLFTILWIVVIVVKSSEIKVDLNETTGKEEKAINQSKFREKLDEMMKSNKSKQ